MDHTKFFLTSVCADRDYISVGRTFYRRWWQSLSDRVTIEDMVGNSFVCYPVIFEGRPYLRTDTEQIIRLYVIPNGAVMEMKYIGRSRFRFKIPLSAEVPVELPVEDNGADASSEVGDDEHAVGDEEHQQYDYPDSDDGGEVVDSGPGGNANEDGN